MKGFFREARVARSVPIQVDLEDSSRAIRAPCSDGNVARGPSVARPPEVYRASLADGVGSESSVSSASSDSHFGLSLIRALGAYEHPGGQGVCNKFRVEGKYSGGFRCGCGHRMRTIRGCYSALQWNREGFIGKGGNGVRQGSCIVVENLEVRATGSARSIMRIHGGHHLGLRFGGSRLGSKVPASLPDTARLVFIGVLDVCLCSVCGVAFVGSAWPRIA